MGRREGVNCDPRDYRYHNILGTRFGESWSRVAIRQSQQPARSSV